MRAVQTGALPTISGRGALASGRGAFGRSAPTPVSARADSAGRPSGSSQSIARSSDTSTGGQPLAGGQRLEAAELELAAHHLLGVELPHRRPGPAPASSSSTPSAYTSSAEVPGPRAAGAQMPTDGGS